MSRQHVDRFPQFLVYSNRLDVDSNGMSMRLINGYVFFGNYFDMGVHLSAFYADTIELL